MAARRLIMAMLVLLVLSSVLAALVPVERNRLDDETSSSARSTREEPPVPTGERVRRMIAVDDATPDRIELARGDQLALTVTSTKLADQVEIPAFGLTEDVDPEFPARFDILALSDGSFRVRLVEAGRVIARIEVAKNGDHGNSSDSPGSSKESSTPGASSAS